MKASKILPILFLICFPVVSALSAPRHTYHTSLTRIDYNAGQKIFEISINLFQHDLLPFLEKRAGKRINLEATEADALIQKYLNQQFVLTDKNGEAKELKWVGKELDVDSVWIYLEVATTESLEGYSLQNTIFFESFDEQTNHVFCRFDDKKLNLVFKANDRTKLISTT